MPRTTVLSTLSGVENREERPLYALSSIYILSSIRWGLYTWTYISIFFIRKLLSITFGRDSSVVYVEITKKQLLAPRGTHFFSEYISINSKNSTEALKPCCLLWEYVANNLQESC